MLRKMNVLLLLLLSLQVFCGAQRVGRTGYFEIMNIPESRPNDRLSHFLAYSVEDQIDIYLYSDSLHDTVTPPIRYYLTVEGEDKIPAIIARIDKLPQDSPLPKESLISALNVIDQECECLTTEDVRVLTRNEMNLIESDHTGLDGFRERYSRILKEIIVRHEPLPPK